MADPSPVQGAWQGFSPAARPLLFPVGHLPSAGPTAPLYLRRNILPRLGLEFTATCCWTAVRRSRGCWGSFSNMADSGKPLGGKPQSVFPPAHRTHSPHARGAENCKNVLLSLFKSLLEASACKCLKMYSNNLKNHCWFIRK